MTTPLIWAEDPSPPREGPAIPVTDRGLLYGQGLFETFLLQGGRPFRLPEHLGRMAASAAALHLPSPRPGWQERVARAAAELGKRLGAIRGRGRLTLTAGDLLDGDPSAPAREARLFLAVHPLPELPAVPRVRTALVAGPPAPGGADALTTHKTLAYLGNLLCLAAARRAGADEGLVQTRDGLLVGGARASLILVREGRLLTPGPAAGPLDGLTRHRLLTEVAPALGLGWEAVDLTAADLATAPEAFLCSSLMGVAPVTLAGPGRRAGPGPVTSTIIKAYASILAAGAGTE